MSSVEYAPIGIVDNDPLVLQALRSMFTDAPAPINVLWSICDAKEAIKYCLDPTTKPLLVLIDLKMPQMDGKELSDYLLKLNVKTIIMTAFQIKYSPEELQKSGISAVIHKESSLQDYVQTIGEALHNNAISQWQEKTIETCRLRLTDREISILRKYLHGRTTATTAKLLHLSEGTVKTHLNNAYKKLGVNNRSEAIYICVKNNIL